MPRTKNPGTRGGRSGRRPGKGRTAIGGKRAAGVLREMTALHQELATQCAAIQTEMDALASAIDTLQGGRSTARTAPSGGGRTAKRGRPVKSPNVKGAIRGPRGEGASLKDFIMRVLTSAGSPMRLTDVADAVVSAGYPTTSQNLPNQVSMALNAMKKQKRIKKVGRGMYQA